VEPATKRRKGERQQETSPDATATTTTNTTSCIGTSQHQQQKRNHHLPRDPQTIVSWNANGLAPRSKTPSNLVEFQRLLRVAGTGSGSASSTSADSASTASTSTCIGSSSSGTAVCPDLICIQEARLKRAISANNGSSSSGGWGAGGQPDPKELREIQPFLRITQASGYDAIWSLADGRRAGTLALVHRRLLSSPAAAGCSSSSGSGSGSDMIRKNFCAFTLDGALSLLLASYGLDDDSEMKKLVGTCGGGGSDGTRNGSSGSQKRSSSSSGGGGSGSKQSSMMAFMVKPSSTTTASASGSRASAAGTSTDTTSTSASATTHDAEGRMQYLRFATLDILHTYVPNNGTKAESHARRRAFDENVRRFLSARQRILERADDVNRPIMWLGDLNVARTYLDGTHYRIIDSDGTTTAAAAADEYWTDERRCYAKNQVPRGPRSKDDVGIPGFTPNERRRFESILSEANLVDIWRHLHPAGVASDILPYLGRHGGTSERNPWDRANYTWRGTTGRNQAVARYQGKGQRIDYFLISRSAVGDGDGDGGRVVSCDIMGYGERREGYFCGSDHCPIVLVMKDDASAAAAGGGKGRYGSNGDNGDDDRKLPAKEKAAPAEKDIIDLT